MRTVWRRFRAGLYRCTGTGTGRKNEYGIVLSAESEEMRQHFSPSPLWPLSLLRNVPEENHHTDQQTIYQEVSALLVKLFEMIRRTSNLKRDCTKIWNWTA